MTELPLYAVSPTVAIMQWRNEIAAHTDGLKVLIWHGHARESNTKELQKYDVVCWKHVFISWLLIFTSPKVLTTYAVLERYVLALPFFNFILTPIVRKLLPKATKWLQAPGKDYQGKITSPSDSLEPCCCTSR